MIYLIYLRDVHFYIIVARTIKCIAYSMDVEYIYIYIHMSNCLCINITHIICAGYHQNDVSIECSRSGSEQKHDIKEPSKHSKVG